MDKEKAKQKALDSAQGDLEKIEKVFLEGDASDEMKARFRQDMKNAFLAYQGFDVPPPRPLTKEELEKFKQKGEKND